MKSILFLISILCMINCDIGDKKPFCNFPEVFHTTLQAANVQLDVQRYLGDWHEVARTYNKNEKDCACSEAHYEFDEEKKFLKVTNSCLKIDGTTKSANAKAYPKNDNLTIYKLYFVPVFGGNYWIIDLAEDYSWVVIGEPCRDQLFILSRTVPMNHDVMHHLVQRAQAQGFDTSNLILRSETCKEEKSFGVEA